MTYIQSSIESDNDVLFEFFSLQLGILLFVSFLCFFHVLCIALNLGELIPLISNS